MKIVLATCGSRGDVQPMITLGLALKQAGHEVLLVGPPEKTEWARHLGCPYAGFGRDVTAFIDTMPNAVSAMAGLSFVRFVHEEIHHQFRALPPLLSGADLIVGSSLMLGLSSIAEAMGIPYRFVLFTPQLLPSREHPFLAFEIQTFPKWLNRASHRMVTLMDRGVSTALINRHRKQLGLTPIHDMWDHVMGNSPIVACDKEVAKIPADVTKPAVQTGYLHLDLPRPLRPDLDAFLASGAPPVYAGFGSMPPTDQEKTTPILREACRRAGVRLIIARPWNPPDTGQVDDDLFVIHAFPHLHLFPATAAAIHHGGAGTTAAAAASGVPQIIVPHILDQFYHGHRVYRSGLGPKPIPRKQLTAKIMAAALRRCMDDPVIRKNAETAGRRIDPVASWQAAAEAIQDEEPIHQ